MQVKMKEGCNNTLKVDSTDAPKLKSTIESNPRLCRCDLISKMHQLGPKRQFYLIEKEPDGASHHLVLGITKKH